MINSRDVNELSLQPRKICFAHIEGCSKAGIELLITSTYRDAESQNALYAIGRIKQVHQKRVTNAMGGQSWHQYRCAWDVVPLVGGKCVWDDADLWKEIKRIGKAVGAELGPAWEQAHFQLRPEPTFTIDQALNRWNEMGTIFL